MAEFPTRSSLLVRLRESPSDQDAWNDFVERYGPQIYAWCRHWKLQEADAQDVTQTVLLKLARTLPTFVYDPARSFRGWLRTLTHNAWNDFMAEQHGAVRAAGDSVAADLLRSAQARDDLVARLEQAFDRELLDMAMAEVRGRVEAQTWQAFELTAVQGVAAAEAAGRLGMRIGTVYQARSNVQRLIKEALARLAPPGGDE
jgi:RNA polymerase sigma-70 factor (ECF subfamily)